MLKLILLPATCSAIIILIIQKKLIFLRSTQLEYKLSFTVTLNYVSQLEQKAWDFSKDLLLRLYNLQVFQPADKKVASSLPAQLDR